MSRKNRFLCCLTAAIFLFLSLPLTMAAAAGPSIQISYDSTAIKAGKPLTASWKISGVDKSYSYVVCDVTGLRDQDTGYKTLLYKRGEKSMKSAKVPTVEGDRIKITIRLLAADSATVVYEESTDWLPVQGYKYDPVSVEFTFSTLAAQPGMPLTASWKISGLKDPVDFMHAGMELFKSGGGTERLVYKIEESFFDSVTCSSVPLGKYGDNIYTFIWFGQTGGWSHMFQAPYIPVLNEYTTLVLPKGLTKVEAGAFENGAFEVVVIPEGCTSVGDRAFANCRNLKIVFAPKGFSNYAGTAFAGCGPIMFRSVGYNDD